MRRYRILCNIGWQKNEMAFIEMFFHDPKIILNSLKNCFKIILQLKMLCSQEGNDFSLYMISLLNTCDPMKIISSTI